MVCLGFEPGAAGWKAQTKPRSYGGHPDAERLLLDSLKSFMTGATSLDVIKFSV